MPKEPRRKVAYAKSAMPYSRPNVMAPGKKEPNSSRGNPRANMFKAPPMGLSLTHICSLRYVETTTLTPSGTTPGFYVFSLNGLYDPNITGVGHQPLGFDQLMTLYDHYFGLKAKVHIQWMNDSTFTGALVGYSITDTNAITTPLSNRLENPWTRSVPVNDVASPPIQQTVTIDLAEFFGRKISDLEDTTLRGTSTGNPADQAYLIVWSQLVNSGASALNVDIVVTIEYYAAFTEPKDLASS